MPDFDYVVGMASEYGHGDPDHDAHDPSGHLGGKKMDFNNLLALDDDEWTRIDEDAAERRGKKCAHRRPK